MVIFLIILFIIILDGILIHKLSRLKKKTKSKIMNIGILLMIIGYGGCFEEIFRIVNTLEHHPSFVPFLVLGGIGFVGMFLTVTIDAINIVDDPGNFPDWWGA